MGKTDNTDGFTDGLTGHGKLLEHLDSVLQTQESPQKIFSELTNILQRKYDIRKGMLALRHGDQTQFLAVATWNRGKSKKNLSLRLPTRASLFEKVAEHGQIYSETFAELFDGNLIEKHLLLDDETQSFVLRPLKHEAQVVALLGYSSDNPNAFVTFEEGFPDPFIERFAALIARNQMHEDRA